MGARLIMIVDDDHDIRETMQELFEQEGYAALTFANGQEALAYLEGDSAPLPDLILLDLMMPVMDGLEFRRRQHANPKLSAVPVVLVTAAGELADDQMPFDLVVYKPVRVDELLESVRHLFKV